LAALEVRSAQTPAQSVVPLGQAQSPFEQVRLLAQICAQNPQLSLSVRRSTHWLPHFASPDPQVIEQVPVLQTSPPMQRLPHVPQFAALTWRSTHCSFPMKSVHIESPVGQMQVPLEQLPPAAQALPQLPQSALLVSRFTQTIMVPIIPPPVQSVRPVAHPAVQVPPTHEFPDPQPLPHEPQLRGSVSVSVQVPLQLVSPPPQTHAPFVQLAPVPHCVPQAPRCCSRWCRRCS
jgi:hypothetical protein